MPQYSVLRVVRYNTIVSVIQIYFLRHRQSARKSVRDLRDLAFEPINVIKTINVIKLTIIVILTINVTTFTHKCDKSSYHNSNKICP